MKMDGFRCYDQIVIRCAVVRCVLAGTTKKITWFEYWLCFEIIFLVVASETMNEFYFV